MEHRIERLSRRELEHVATLRDLAVASDDMVKDLC
jgi:hypothetical protein